VDDSEHPEAAAAAADPASIGDPAPETEGPAPEDGQRSPLVAAGLSFIFPGIGQAYLGRRTSAVVFALPALVAVLWALLQLSNGLVYFALGMLDDGYALTVMAVAAAFTAWRLVAIAHPFFAVGPARLGGRAAVVLAALVIATIAMGDVAFSNAYAAYNADREIATNDFHQPDTSPEASFEPDETPLATVEASASFLPLPSVSPSGPTPTPFVCPDYPVKLASAAGGTAAFAAPVAAPPAAAPDTTLPADPSPSAAATTLPTTDISPSPSPSPGATPTDSGGATPSPSPSSAASPSPSAAATPNPYRVTILLTGVDMMSGRRHALNDTIILVSIDLRTRNVSMVSVPRDTAAFPFYWGGAAPVNYKINRLAGSIAAGHFGSPDPPMVTLANEIGFLVGVKVDYWAEIDIDGFGKLVEAVGGVDIYNPTLLNDPFTCTYVPVGNVHLDATNALRYVRSRETSTDWARSGRQQRVLVALEKKIASPAMLPRLSSLLALVGKSVATNFPLNTARNYTSVAENLASISTCVLGPPYSYHPDMSLSGGYWTSRLLLDRVANLSVALFGTDSLYYGKPGVTPQSCRNHY
jgi:polyisoprenyl-teichoic acid--peptidoglycan teichoic acid transferase